MDADMYLKKWGLKFEDLNSDERETYFNMVSAMQQKQLSIDDLKEKITQMRESLLLEVSQYENNSKQDLLVKARIRNYTLLIGILSGPEKARQALDQALGNIKKK